MSPHRSAHGFADEAGLAGEHADVVEFAPGTPVVILEVVEPASGGPSYCAHSKVTCVGSCGEWLWLGHGLDSLVRAGQAEPWCAACVAGTTGMVGGSSSELL